MNDKVETAHPGHLPSSNSNNQVRTKRKSPASQNIRYPTGGNNRPYEASSKYRSYKLFGAFALFTIISMLVAILVVRFTTPSETKKTCEPIMNTVYDKFMSQDSHPQFLLTYDFNNDTLMDIAVVSSGTNNVGIFFGKPNATFAEQVTFSTGVGSHPSSIAVADLNNDGYLDIVVSNYGSHTIGILFGNANGTFRDQITYPVGSSRPLKIALGDLNNDSFVDIVVVNNGTNIVGILFGSDNATFQSQIQLSSTYD
ncbi:unnamed protein product, partial [Adineta ricciae]